MATAEEILGKPWKNLPIPLSVQVKAALKDMGFKYMAAVQSACIPLFMSNKDVVVEAKTGSGKTLAFLVPLLEMLLQREEPLRKKDVGAIIVTPTRELAVQIDEVLGQFIEHLPQFTKLLLIGGNNPMVDINRFQENGAHILVGTPGRLENLLEREADGCNLAASVKALEVLVLDEADRLLDLGFAASINTILSYLPKQRRTGLFSATQTEELEELIRAGMRNPVRINIRSKGTVDGTSMEQRTPTTLKNYFMLCESDEKFNQLVHFLRGHRNEKHMVFFSTCACVDYFSKALKQILKKTEVLCIHGKKDSRNKVFSTFRSLPRQAQDTPEPLVRMSENGVLVCTDVMGRGVDIPEVNWVIQYDPPSDPRSFVHRCGRTARIGNEGSALALLLPKEDTFVQFVAINQKVPLDEYAPADDVTDILPKLKKMALADRAMYIKGMQAFVSFVQSYAKHQCNLIFQLKDLDMGKLARGFGLLQLPKMPEMKGKKIEGFEPVDIDTSVIPFKEKSREKQRQQKLKIFQETGEMPGKKKFVKVKTVPWSIQKEKKERKVKRREVKERKRKRKEEMDEDDLDDLAKDARLLKKFKKGKISKTVFNKEFAGDSDISSEGS